MAKLLPWIGGALVACAALVAIPIAEAMRSPQVETSASTLVSPLPAAIKYTANCAMPQGGAGCCVVLDGGGYGVNVTCRSATDCDLRFGTHNVDGGGPVFADGGGFVLIGSDVPLLAGNSRVFGLPPPVDSVCMGTPDGGTNSVGVTYP